MQYALSVNMSDNIGCVANPKFERLPVLLRSLCEFTEHGICMLERSDLHHDTDVHMLSVLQAEGLVERCCSNDRYEGWRLTALGKKHVVVAEWICEPKALLCIDKDKPPGVPAPFEDFTMWELLRYLHRSGWEHCLRRKQLFKVCK